MENIIDRYTLENIFVTAIEGASTYWCYLSDSTINKIRNVVPKNIEECLSIATFIAMYDYNIDIQINDAENENEILGFISKKTIEARLKKLIDDGYEDVINAEINEEGDASSSDLIFQYITMNEIVFG